MASSFWQTLARPILGLSPMDGVTDHPFRSITKKYGQPSIIVTEFTSVEGVCHRAISLLKDFLYDETQRPIIGQIYGTTPDFFRQTAILLCELGFDGIDINMGCPAKNVAHSGAGASLILTPHLAQDIIRATKQGIEEWHNGATAANCPDISTEIASEISSRKDTLPSEYQSRTRSIPVSVKTRIGYYKPQVDEWLPYLIEMTPACIALHGRTLKQQYGGQANWDEIGTAAQRIKSAKTGILILGNGDVKDRADALTKVNTYGVDGVLIGRAAMGNPYVFLDSPRTTHPSRFQIALEHAKLFERTYADDPRYNFLPMRKHLGWYVREIPNAAEIRIALFKTNSAAEVQTILNQYELL